MCHSHFCPAPPLHQERTHQIASAITGHPRWCCHTLSQAPSLSPTSRGLHTQPCTGKARPYPSAQSHSCTATPAIPAAHDSHRPHVTPCPTVPHGAPRCPMVPHANTVHPSTPAICPQPFLLDWGRGVESSRRGGGLAFMEGDSSRYF